MCCCSFDAKYLVDALYDITSERKMTQIMMPRKTNARKTGSTAAKKTRGKRPLVEAEAEAAVPEIGPGNHNASADYCAPITFRNFVLNTNIRI